MTNKYQIILFRFTDMRPTSNWADMSELSFALTKKGKQEVSSEEAKELGVGQFIAR